MIALQDVSPAVEGGMVHQKQPPRINRGTAGCPGPPRESGPGRAHLAAECAARGPRRKLRLAPRAAHSAAGPLPPTPVPLRRNHCAPRGHPPPRAAPPLAPRPAQHRPAQHGGGARAPCLLRASPLWRGARARPPSFWAVVGASGRWERRGWGSRRWSMRAR